MTAVGARGQDWGRLIVLAEPSGTARRRGSWSCWNAAPPPWRSTGCWSATARRWSARPTAPCCPGSSPTRLTVSEVALRARALGVPLEGRRLVGVVLRLRGGPASAALEAQARLRDFTETAALAARERGLSALIGGLDDGGVGMLVSLGPSDDEHAALEGFAAALDRLTDCAAPGPAFLMAAGSSVGSLRDARRTLLEAAQVADAASHSNSPKAGTYYRLPDVRLRGLLHLLRDDARLQTYVERELGPLLAYDAECGSDLVRILTVYLACGRNKSAAADAAHLSRPSFYDRLHRVERMLGTDLDQVESCLSLHVALLALEAVRGQAPRA